MKEDEQWQRTEIEQKIYIHSKDYWTLHWFLITTRSLHHQFLWKWWQTITYKSLRRMYSWKIYTSGVIFHWISWIVRTINNCIPKKTVEEEVGVEDREYLLNLVNWNEHLSESRYQLFSFCLPNSVPYFEVMS